MNLKLLGLNAGLCLLLGHPAMSGPVGRTIDSDPQLASARVGPDKAAVNRALALDGKNDCVQIPVADSIRKITKAITLEASVKAFSFYPNPGSVNSILRKNLEAGAENFFLRFRNVEGPPLLEVGLGRQIGVVRAPSPIKTNQWCHLAATYDGHALTVYVDGVKIQSGALTGELSLDASDLYIGRGDPDFSLGEFFHGLVDEVRIWNVARAQAEIQATMGKPLTGKEKGLAGYWNFDDGSVKDISGRGNNGRLVGHARIVESPRPGTSRSEVKRSGSVESPEAGNEPLTLEKRLEVVEALWRNLSEIYPALEYKGVQGRAWIEPALQRGRESKNDQEFYGILLEQMARLKDTHSRIILYPGQTHLERPPVLLNQVEGKVAIIRADASTALLPGEVVLSIDAQPVAECLSSRLKRVCNSTERGRWREACEQLLSGRAGTSVNVEVRATNGVVRSVQLMRAPWPQLWQEPAIAHRGLPNDVGYIRISRWVGEDLPQQFDQTLEALKDTHGIVIDVRGNGGGNDSFADLVNGRLTDRPVLASVDFWRKAGTDEYRRSVSWVQPRGPWTYRGRVAALIDEASASACEHFVSGLEAIGRVLLVGQPTNGAGGGPVVVTLPDGTRVAISRALGLRANGVVFEGHGIPPHIYSAPTLDDLASGRDAALEIATDWLLSDKDIPARAQRL